MRHPIPRTAARSARRPVRLAAVLAALMAPAAAEAQVIAPPIEPKPAARPVRHYFQPWVGFTPSGPIVEPLLVFAELGAGFYDDMHPVAVYARPAIGVQLPHGFSVHVGYGYTSFWNPRHERGDEHMLFEQVAYKAPIVEVDLLARVRAEQRFQAGSDVGYRLRTVGQINVPLWKRAPLQVVLWDELYLGLNQPAPWQPELLDMNLYFAGLGWQPNAHFRMEAGYQGAVVPRRDEMAFIHGPSVSILALW